MLTAEKRVRTLEEDNRQLRREASELRKEVDKLRKEVCPPPSARLFSLSTDVLKNALGTVAVGRTLGTHVAYGLLRSALRSFSWSHLLAVTNFT